MPNPTRYEITATTATPDATCYHVGFSRQVTRRGLLTAVQAVGPELIEALSIGDDEEFTFSFTGLTMATVLASDPEYRAAPLPTLTRDEG